MTDQYTEANKLLDVFESRDRDAAQQALEELRERVSERVYQRAVYLARQQFQMYERYHRLHSWRADWIEQQQRARAEHEHKQGRVSDGTTDHQRPTAGDDLRRQGDA